MLEEPPARVLAVSDEAAMRDLAGAFPCPVEDCPTAAISADPRLAAGALALAPPATLPALLALLPKSHPAVPIFYSDAGEQIEIVRRAAKPSVVAVVSISPFFLEIERGVLNPAIADRHFWPHSCSCGMEPDPPAPRTSSSAARSPTPGSGGVPAGTR